MNRRDYLRDGRSPIPEKDSTSKVMSSIKAKNTKPELALRKALCQNGLTGYRIHWKTVPGKPDISFPGRHIAIFVNGCFWHRCPFCNPPFPKTHEDFWRLKFEKNKKRDQIKIQELENLGWKAFVFWECQIRCNVSGCVHEIESYLFKGC